MFSKRGDYARARTLAIDERKAGRRLVGQAATGADGADPLDAGAGLIPLTEQQRVEAADGRACDGLNMVEALQDRRDVSRRLSARNDHRSS